MNKIAISLNKIITSKINQDKVLATAASIFIAVALLVIAITPPATGYEISIYDAYPLYFWFFLLAALFCGIGILVRHNSPTNKTRWFLIGIVIIIFTNVVLLLLPEFRGYFLYGRGDTLYHLGCIRDIVNTGHVGKSNFYPIEHILGTNIIQLTGISINHIPYLFFVIFYTLYIVGMSLLARTLTNSNSRNFVIVAFSAVLVYCYFYVNIHPCFTALFILPLFLYLCHKKNRLSTHGVANVILLILVSFFITFCHPITALYVIIVLLTFGLADILYSKFIIHRNSNAVISQRSNVGKGLIGISLMMSVVFFAWYFSFASIEGSFDRVISGIFRGSETSQIFFESDLLSNSGLTHLQIIELFVNRHGSQTILLLISIMACIYFLYRGFIKSRGVHPVRFAYSIQFIVALLITAAMMFGYFVEYEGNPTRVLRFPLFIGTILSGLAVGDFINWVSNKHPGKKKLWILNLAIVCLFVSMSALSIRSVYPSPITSTPNSQVTNMEVAGTYWFKQSQDVNTPGVANSYNSIYLLDYYNFGSDSIVRASMAAVRLPSHFGYDSNVSLAESLSYQPRYVIITGFDLVAPMFYPENVRQRAYQWTQDDFVKLGSDTTVSVIYTNGGFEVFKIGD